MFPSRLVHDAAPLINCLVIPCGVKIWKRIIRSACKAHQVLEVFPEAVMLSLRSHLHQNISQMLVEDKVLFVLLEALGATLFVSDIVLFRVSAATE